MTYAEAVNEALTLIHPSEEALAVLRRAGKVMEKVEEAVPPDRPAYAGRRIGEKVWEGEVLRACAEYRKGKKCQST